VVRHTSSVGQGVATLRPESPVRAIQEFLFPTAANRLEVGLAGVLMGLAAFAEEPVDLSSLIDLAIVDHRSALVPVGTGIFRDPAA
jgi:hypothetical protein